MFTAFRLKKRVQCFCLLTKVECYLCWHRLWPGLSTSKTQLHYLLFGKRGFFEVRHNCSTLGGRIWEPLKPRTEVSEWCEAMLAINSFHTHQGTPDCRSSIFCAVLTKRGWADMTAKLRLRHACDWLEESNQILWGQKSSFHDFPFQKDENPICNSTETQQYTKKLKKKKNWHFSAAQLLHFELITLRMVFWGKRDTITLPCPRNATVALTEWLQALLCSPQSSFALSLTGLCV